jgi:hypothetical protein
MTVTYSKKFEDAVAHVFKEEGGFINHPKDKGNATNWGISKSVYEEHLGRSASVSEIKEMPRDVAKEIYHKQFWEKMNGDSIQNPKLSKVIFSQFVNRGPRVFRDIKKELGVNSTSTTFDENAVNALNSVQDDKSFLVNRIENNRKFHEKIVENNPDQAVFLRGWMRRNDNDAKSVGIEPVPRYISADTTKDPYEDSSDYGFESHKAYDLEPEINFLEEAYDDVTEGDFLFNDQKLDIPPEQISIQIDEYENSVLLMRTETPVTTQSGRKKIRIIVNFSVDTRDGWTKLSKIITQIRKTPIATIENEKIRKELFGDYPDYENIGVVVDNISGYVEDDFPTLIRCTLQMSWFNHAPYIEAIKYKEKSDKEGRIIYQTKPSSLYKKFYMEGTSNAVSYTHLRAHETLS